MYFDFLPEEQKTQIQTHLSSFLKWVSRHNPDFQSTLTREELTSCWLHDFKHPAWVQQKINQIDIEFIAHVNEYFDFYSKQAHLFSEAVVPEFKPEDIPQKQPIQKTSPTPAASSETITSKQLKFLGFLTKKHNRYTDISLNGLGKTEASQMISELVALG